MTHVRIVSAHGCHCNIYRMVPSGTSIDLIAHPFCNLPSEMAEVLYDRHAYATLQQQHPITKLQAGDVYPDLKLNFEQGVISATPHGVFEEDVYGTSGELFRMRALNDQIRSQSLAKFSKQFNRRPSPSPAIQQLSDILGVMGQGHYIVAVCRKPCAEVHNSNKIVMQTLDSQLPLKWPRGLSTPSADAATLKQLGLGRAQYDKEAVVNPQSMDATTKAIISRLLEGVVPSRTRTQKRLRETGHYTFNSKYRK